MTAPAKSTAEKLLKYRARLKECMDAANDAYKREKWRALQAWLRSAEQAAYKVAEKAGVP